jgi:hypothetical protein
MAHDRVVGELEHFLTERARWTLYVNPQTYLPVRMVGRRRRLAAQAAARCSSP